MLLNAIDTMTKDLDASIDELYMYIKVISIFFPLVIGLIIYIWNRSVSKQDTMVLEVKQLNNEVTRLVTSLNFLVASFDNISKSTEFQQREINDIKVNCATFHHKKQKEK